ncbi:MAG: sigma-70 family RNA polymerase sigma factor, partial [candidate division Zixibacteria bacterium]|nr:sigma-70 family RNA polymerase sigma factor [candidate division Zixibacteria bacterium]
MRGFDTMVDQCRHRLFSFAYYNLGDREEAKDVVQDVLIKLWENWDSIEKGRVMSWLLQVTRNRCLDIHRTRQTRTTLLRQNQNSIPPGQSMNRPENPETTLENSDFRRQVEAGLQVIEEPYRSIVILREIEDYTYAQICAALDMPLNTV